MRQPPDGYSARWLAANSSLTLEDILGVILEHSIRHLKSRGDYIILREELPRFFQITGRDAPKLSFTYPAFLTGPGTPWRDALARMYAEAAAYPASISPSQGELVRSLILNQAPQRALEIGCFIGVSTMWILGAMEEVGQGVLHSIDLFHDKIPFGVYKHLYFPDVLPYLQGMIAAAGLAHRSRLHVGDSKDIGRDYAARIGDELDFLFIDGDHSIPGCSRDFELYAPHVRSGGIILLHDIFPGSCCDGPPWTILNQVRTNPGLYDLVELPTRPKNYGMCIIIKK